MAICKLTITTSVDGETSKIVRMGKIEEKGGWICLYYREENAEITLRLSAGRALIARLGDYSLRLPLFQGEESEGTIGIGGNEGSVPIKTDKVNYTNLVNELHLELRYDLLFGETPQKMRLEIIAKKKGEEK